MNNRMAMLTTNNDTTTLMTSTMKSPLKCLHNEWRCLGHLQHPDEAAKFWILLRHLLHMVYAMH